ncbi:MAG: lipoyl synthase [Candidatus Caldarchaeum sp.]|nr:lipoyl synthase [Candidatus Caldarchaeum sp.]MDW8359589.1 lipoyl synthase [Candidatus Caldarchaeum sp.]
MQSIQKPAWVKAVIPGFGQYPEVKKVLRKHFLHTVCEEALCPNLGECWGGGTATIMILGDICTRSCRFCAVKSGNAMGLVDDKEPYNVAKAVGELGLKYVVLTSVCRDDLPDGGAKAYAETVEAIKNINKNILVEVLIPDFNGDRSAIQTVVNSGPDVVAHNVETVRRLSQHVRDRRASFDQSLRVLRLVKEIDRDVFTKSSIMVGLGETVAEVVEAMRELRSADVDFITVGQYLRPTLRHLPVKEYVHPSVFEHYRQEALKLGFKYAACGPLVRSSYRAGEYFVRALLAR